MAVCALESTRPGRGGGEENGLEPRTLGALWDTARVPGTVGYLRPELYELYDAVGLLEFSGANSRSIP